jgi:uncharacterized protein YkwD
MNLRPLTRMILFGFAFCAFFSFISPADRFAPAVSVDPVSVAPAGMENDILRYVNLHRDSLGLKPLQMNAVESEIAAKHSRDMASGKTPFGHQGIEQRIKAIGKQIGAVMAAGENVAYGQTTAREVVNEWLNSPGHRKNIEGDYALTGIGLASDSRGIPYYTQIFTK